MRRIKTPADGFSLSAHPAASLVVAKSDINNDNKIKKKDTTAISHDQQHTESLTA